MNQKSNWLEEAKKSRNILFSEWSKRGRPLGDFYKWLVDYSSDKLIENQRKLNSVMDKSFRDTIR